MSERSIGGDARSVAQRELRRAAERHVQHILDVFGAEGPPGLIRLLRESQLRVSSCAWCGRLAVGGAWDVDGLGAVLPALAERGMLTHGICPGCFAEVEAHIEYPT